PRKDSFLFGARGTAEQLAVLPRWIVLTQIFFALAFAPLLGWPRTLLFFAGLTLAAAIYNGPLGATKSRPAFDLLSQAAYLLVFFAARDAWIAIFLAVGATWFILDVCWLWRDRAYSAAEACCFFLGWNAAALVSAPLVWKTAALAAH